MAILRELVTLIRFQFDRSGIDEARAETTRLREEMERTAAMAAKLGGSGVQPSNAAGSQADAMSGMLMPALSAIQSAGQSMSQAMLTWAQSPAAAQGPAAAAGSMVAGGEALSLPAMAQTMRGALMQLVPAASLAMMGQFATPSSLPSAEMERPPLHRMLSALEPASSSQETVQETSLTRRIMRQAEALLLPQLPPVSATPELMAGQPSIQQGGNDDPASAFRASLRQEMQEAQASATGASFSLFRSLLPDGQPTQPAGTERAIDLTGALQGAIRAWTARPEDASLSPMSEGIGPGNTAQSGLDILQNLVMALKASPQEADTNSDGAAAAPSLPLLLTSLLPVMEHRDRAVPSSTTGDEGLSAEAQGRHGPVAALAGEASSLLSGLTAWRAALLPSPLSSSVENRAAGGGNAERGASELLDPGRENAGREGVFSMEAPAVPTASPVASLALSPAPLPGLSALRQVLGDMLPPVSLLRDPLHGAAEPDSIGRAAGAVSYVTNVSVGAPSISITAPSGDADTIAALAAQGVSDSLEGSADGFARQANSGDKRSEG
ncbi:hypothetical protein [Granulibacter bethesdensis]|uniref:Uncharacterized protein n=1 Tax=Granulibacter bethesdensis (strain ATCC BAA-1260 / CGDNIH1) TaxID=391165 RepID=Q0BRT3_GRABC|nr:hypothetical protein [Granulibacter bethesdensis]ABI62469.1 Hypothetical protein GbCGDNIH1_1571 [Granulibacter bethesdensis CGDNIH1]APH52309.1 Hypothetical protein GbCGDNIH5_1571 [Granulibacter bethesdensis]APH65003.1 Hypothetical protein GbCGDNIH1I4_1571 [Granulibacter bethesdensis]